MLKKLLFLIMLPLTTCLNSSTPWATRPSSNSTNKKPQNISSLKRPPMLRPISRLALPATPSPLLSAPKNLPIFTSHIHRIEQSIFTLGNCTDLRFSIIFTCFINHEQSLNPENLEFAQDITGTLWAIHKGTKQELGHFPTHTLNIKSIELQWPGSKGKPTESLTLNIPARTFVIKNNN